MPGLITLEEGFRWFMEEEDALPVSPAPRDGCAPYS